MNKGATTVAASPLPRIRFEDNTELSYSPREHHRYSTAGVTEAALPVLSLQSNLGRASRIANIEVCLIEPNLRQMSKILCGTGLQGLGVWVSGSPLKAGGTWSFSG